MKYRLLLLMLMPVWAMAQDKPAKLLKDAKTNCGVYYKFFFQEDSISWQGTCIGEMANGMGSLKGYKGGFQTSGYEGKMRNGWMHGQGKFSYGNIVLKGNFYEGELLQLNDSCLQHFHKEVVLRNDTSELYVGDHHRQDLFYEAIIPNQKINGVLVLLPGTWETTEHLLSSTQALVERAHAQGIAVLALSVNQRLALSKPTLMSINLLLAHAIQTYHLPANKVIMGGWSMGGLFSLRYAELAYEGKEETQVKPIAVFSCDGPCDLENIYDMFQRKLSKNPEASEPRYGVNELERFCGGTPKTATEQFRYYSCYSNALKDGGNARFLTGIPVRIYCDVDPVWWIQNRGLDMYDMNALDQSAMIVLLQNMGNKKAEFINAFGKGYRLEGNRHPHSWSIVEADPFMEWMMEILQN